MKNVFTPVLFLYFILKTSLCLSQNYANLLIDDPQLGSVSPKQGNIDSVYCTIKPKGLFFEVEQEILFSVKGTQFQSYNDSMEIVMNFTLPLNSHIHEAHLLIGAVWVKAILYPKAQATQIYEGYVQRSTDPLIIYKNSPTNYQMRIFPLLKNEPRRMKMKYLIPARRVYDKLTANFDFGFINASKTSPFLKCEIKELNYYNYQFPTVQVSSPFLINYNSSGIEVLKTSNTLNQSYTVKLEYTMEASDSLYYSVYETQPGQGFMSFSYLPSNSDSVKPKNWVFIVSRNIFYYFDTYNPSEYINNFINSFTENMCSNVNPNDKFFFIYADNLNIPAYNNSWMPLTNQNLLNAFLSQSTANYSYENFVNATVNAVDFINLQSDSVEIVYIATALGSSTSSTINSYLNSIQVPYKCHLLQLNGASLSGQLNQIHSRVVSSGGSYVKRNNTNMLEFGNIASSELAHGIEGFEYEINSTNGILFDKEEIMYGNSGVSVNPIQITARYYGDPTVDFSYFVIKNGIVQLSTINNILPMNSSPINEKIWASQYIYNREKVNCCFNDVLAVSMNHEVLSMQTAFLALEPDSNGSEESTTALFDNKENDELKVKLMPNPFSDLINIEIDIENSETVEIEIFDFSGRKIKTLWAQNTSGKAKVLWNGTDDSGNEVSSGIYMIQIKLNGIKKVPVKVIKL